MSTGIVPNFLSAVSTDVCSGPSERGSPVLTLASLTGSEPCTRRFLSLGLTGGPVPRDRKSHRMALYLRYFCLS